MNYANTRARKAANRVIADAFADDLRRRDISVLLLDEQTGHYRIYADRCAIDFWGSTHRFRSLNGSIQGIGLDALRAEVFAKPEQKAA